MIDKHTILLVNTSDHTFYFLDSCCESPVFHHTQTYQSPISSFPKKKQQRQAAQHIL